MAFALIFSDVGVGEWFVLLAVVLVVVGPKRLPSAARKFGQYYAKFRRAADSFKRQLLEMDDEMNRAMEDAAREVEAAANDVAEPFDPERQYDDGYAPDDSNGAEQPASSEPDAQAAAQGQEAASEEPERYGD